MTSTTIGEASFLAKNRDYGVSGSTVPWELSLSEPFSILAEQAWKVTRGSTQVTVVIIDEGFDISRLPENALFELLQVRKHSYPNNYEKMRHGASLAELIVGNRQGYPGVAPNCRLVMIELPSICTKSEEAKAFALALKAKAAVVCCAWGPSPHSVSRVLPTEIANSIDDLALYSRSGLGAIVLFAVSNNHQNTRQDPYVSYPLVTAVAGITKDGQYPRRMAFGKHIAFTAPVSSTAGEIGGQTGLPVGVSGAVALATGAAALLFSANSRLTAHQAIAILSHTARPVRKFSECTWENWCGKSEDSSTDSERLYGSGVINALGAVIAAMRRPGAKWLDSSNTTKETYFGDVQIEYRVRERRFIGGEHAYLGHLGSIAIRNHFQKNDGDLNNVFFGDLFKEFTPNNARPKFSKHVIKLMEEFLTLSVVPGIEMRKYPGGRLPYGPLLALAGDLYETPHGLQNHIDNNRRIINFVRIFQREIEEKFEYDADIPLVWLADVAEIKGEARYLELAQKNYPHFAGDNLLFYLSHHLLAVNAATNCAVAKTLKEAKTFFHLALLSEAFAGHFLTDMFSAGHARVPRYAFLHNIHRDDNYADLNSKLLHDHEGRLGVFLTNQLGQVWYAYGDAKLLRNNGGVNNANTNPLEPWRYASEPLGLDKMLSIGSPEEQVLHPFLAASLVFASLADVLRHTASEMTLESSAKGMTENSTGILGYILERVPFALPLGDISPGLTDALVERFKGEFFEKAHLKIRLQDVESLYTTFQKITFFIKAPATEYLFLPLHFFEKRLWGKYLQSDNVNKWSHVQSEHLRSQLNSALPLDNQLNGVPHLLNGFSFHFPTTLTKDTVYDFDSVSMPRSWKEAIPPALIQALTNSVGKGVWW